MKLDFEDCSLDTAARQVVRGGTVVPMEPKMYLLLEVLIQRRPAVVRNDELDEILWPKVYVSRTSLTRLVSELRNMLGDSPRESRIIRTVYKTGYAFAASVTTAAVRAMRPTLAAFIEWNDRMMQLEEGENILGRGAECTLVIDARTVSRRHARIRVAGDVASIEDLNSTNGTFVNKQPAMAAVLLKDGDEVSLGRAAARFRMSDRCAPTELRTKL